jgi:hypothetical protein
MELSTLYRVWSLHPPVTLPYRRSLRRPRLGAACGSGPPARSSAPDTCGTPGALVLLAAATCSTSLFPIRRRRRDHGVRRRVGLEPRVVAGAGREIPRSGGRSSATR